MSGSTMISVRNNLNLLSKRKKLRNRLGGYNPNCKTEYNLPSATPKQLKDISKRIKEEQNIRMLKLISVTVILFVLLLCGFIYVTDVFLNY